MSRASWLEEIKLIQLINEIDDNKVPNTNKEWSLEEMSSYWFKDTYKVFERISIIEYKTLLYFTCRKIIRHLYLIDQIQVQDSQLLWCLS